jgi:hypothetical protein
MRSEKKSINSCQKHCKGRIIGYDRYCKHIESRLPPKTSRRLSGVVDVENIATHPNQTTTEERVRRLTMKLKRYGFQDHEINLLLARAVDELKLREIVEEFNWTSIGAANHHYRQALKKLRKLGFK